MIGKLLIGSGRLEKNLVILDCCNGIYGVCGDMYLYSAHRKSASRLRLKRVTICASLTTKTMYSLARLLFVRLSNEKRQIVDLQIIRNLNWLYSFFTTSRQSPLGGRYFRPRDDGRRGAVGGMRGRVALYDARSVAYLFRPKNI